MRQFNNADHSVVKRRVEIFYHSSIVMKKYYPTLTTRKRQAKLPGGFCEAVFFTKPLITAFVFYLNLKRFTAKCIFMNEASQRFLVNR
jgi:hypothetical protein